MPAIEMARLRAQIQSLTARFSDPEEFYQGLKGLLDLHANRAYRSGQAVQPQPLLPSYRVSPLVMRQLEQDLINSTRIQPQQALLVVDPLWKDDYLEPRLLAATMLGVVPIEYGPEVIKKLQEWAQPAENLLLMGSLFQSGTIELRRSNPQLLIDQIETWLANRKTEVKRLGILGLIPMIEDEEFENIPPIFRVLGPLVQNVPNAVFADLQAVIESLAKRTPTETAFFLRQSFNMTTEPTTARLIRRCLPAFPVEHQANLRKAMQSQNT